jgi:biopolymer transport protein ExbD
MAARLDSGDDELVESHEINVTPFIDVMLVLLIIFMVAAPLSTVDVPVELPNSAARPTPRPDKPVFVTLKSDRTLRLGGQEVTTEGLPSALDATTKGVKDTRVFLRADRTVRYEDVMGVLNKLQGAGYSKIGLVGLEMLQQAPAVQPQ